ncbi:MAG: peptidase U32 family protein [Candidatus Gracilibacteria bacterium]
MKPQILAPVGSFEALSTAILAGADSIYFGVEQLNMRSRSSHNFTLDEIKEVVKQCHKAGIKAYLTLNTILYDHDLKLMQKIVSTAKKCGVDAAIVQDVSALQYANSIGLEVHASTQLSISNYESVKFYSKFADTIVLAREVDIKMIKNICERIKKEKLCGPKGELVKIEVFVHGALCIAQSGRCQMSLLQNNTSAQRGACLQECRKKYRIFDDETGKEMMLWNSYVMSPKDLCALPFLDLLCDAGVSVFKIEGRARAPEYVDTVVHVYKEAVDAIGEKSFTKKKILDWMKRLSKVYNRGFCDGYYLGKELPDFSGYSGNHAVEEKVYIGEVSHYFPRPCVAEISVLAHELKKDDKIVIIGPTTGVKYGIVKKIVIDDKEVGVSGKPALVTIPFAEKVRVHDKIYIVKTREQNEDD